MQLLREGNGAERVLENKEIGLYDTDGSVGAAKGAGMGAGIYKDGNEAFATLEKLEVIAPDEANRDAYRQAYENWKKTLEQKL